MTSIRNRIFRWTPIGRADQDLKKYLDDHQEFDKEKLKEYDKVLKKYRANKGLHNGVKVLLYAGIITSIATTIGFTQAQLIAQIASYIGVTVLLILYGITLYFSQLYKEDFHVKREILISNAETKQ